MAPTKPCQIATAADGAQTTKIQPGRCSKIGAVMNGAINDRSAKKMAATPALQVRLIAPQTC